MWGYTEDGSLEEGYENSEKDDRKIIKGQSEPLRGVDRKDLTDGRSLASTNTSINDAPTVSKKPDEHAQHVFLFSLTAPKSSSKKALLFDKS